MAVSRGIRIGAVALLAALALALVALFAGDSSSGADAGSGYRPPKKDQTGLLLRLTDLPPGYVGGLREEGENAGGNAHVCEVFTRSQDELPALGALVRAYGSTGCVAAYERLYTPPGEEARSPVVFSALMALGSVEGAEAAWPLVPGLLRSVTRGKRALAKVRPPLKLGGATRLFHTAAVPFPTAASGSRASLLAWRSGKVVAVVAAISDSIAQNDATVAELAPRQQEHLRKPTPYTAAEAYDGEVALDDPALNLPVYWLGRYFRPGGGIRKSELYGSYFSAKPLPEREVDGFDGTYVQGPEPSLELNYIGINLDTWTPEEWPLFAGSETAKEITAWKCTKKRALALPAGRATIFGGYRRDFSKCPKKPPREFTAWVELGGVKLVVNAPSDAYRFGPPLYDSFEAMEAVVEGLKLRPKPVL